MKRKRQPESDQAEAAMVERLWLVCLSRWTKQSRAARLVDVKEELVAMVASKHSQVPADPLLQKFKSSGAYIQGRTGWIVDRIVDDLKPGRRAIRQLHSALDERLAGYARKYWLTPKGHIEKILVARGVVEHIKVDLSMLCGFNLWLERFSPGATEDPEQLDLSRILGFQQRRRLKVMVSNFDFPSSDRLHLVAALPKRVQQALKKLSPAGEIAYSSMTLAVKRAIAKQQDQAETDPEDEDGQNGQNGEVAIETRAEDV